MQAPQWTYCTGSLPIRRQCACVSVRIRGKTCAVLVGGSSGSGTNKLSLSSVECFVPETNNFLSFTPMSIKRRGCSAAVVQDRLVVVIGGRDSVVSATAEALDVYSRKWIPMPRLNSRRYSSAAASVGSSVYTFGGKDEEGCTLNTMEYLIVQAGVNHWQVGPSMEVPRAECAAVAVGSKIYVMGGSNGYSPALSTCEVFDTELMTWSTMPQMIHGRAGCGATCVGGKIVVLGGSNGGEKLSTVEMFDPATNTWTLISSMNAARSHFAVVHCAGYVYAMYGSSSRRGVERMPVKFLNERQPQVEIEEPDNRKSSLIEEFKPPTPPFRPEIADSFGMKDRIDVLKEWTKEASSLHQEYDGRIQQTLSAMAEWYNKRRDMDIEIMRDQCQNWMDETEFLMENATKEIKEKEEFLESNPTYKNSNTLIRDAEGPPTELCCPITMELMEDPVIAADGYMYERKALDKWLKGQKSDQLHSPMTGSLMESKSYIPAHAIRSLCQKYKQMGTTSPKF